MGGGGGPEREGGPTRGRGAARERRGGGVGGGAPRPEADDGGGGVGDEDEGAGGGGDHRRWGGSDDGKLRDEGVDGKGGGGGFGQACSEVEEPPRARSGWEAALFADDGAQQSAHEDEQEEGRTARDGQNDPCCRGDCWVEDGGDDAGRDGCAGQDGYCHITWSEEFEFLLIVWPWNRRPRNRITNKKALNVTNLLLNVIFF